MKKVIAAIVALSLVFALCMTSFAAGILDSATEQQLKKDIQLAFSGMFIVNEDQANKAVKTLQDKGYSKDVIKYGIELAQGDPVYSGAIKANKLELFNAALAAAPETTEPKVTMPATTAPATTSGSGETTTSGGSLFPDLTLPNLPDITLPDINFDEIVSAEELIQKLKDAGIPASAMQTVVDALHTAGVIDDDMYNNATNLINANEPTSESSNEGGIGGFLGGVFDKVSGLFGGLFGGGDDAGDSGNNGGSSDEFGGSDATGDTALISVVAVAAVAGAALLLTKKKEDK